MDGCRSNDGSRHSLQGIFGNNISLIFPVTKKGQEIQQPLARYAKDGKEYHVYKYNGFKNNEIHKQPEAPCRATTANDDDFMDLIKIEEELLDPRWYSELGTAHNVPEAPGPAQQQTNQQQAASYNELVEAMTPFVHFKENVKSNTGGSSKSVQKGKELAGKKSQILNGVKPGRLLNSNRLTRGTEIKTYVLEKPRCLPTITGSDLLLTNSGGKVPISNNSKSDAKLPVAISNSTKLPVANANLKISGNNNNAKLPASNTSNNLKVSAANSVTTNIVVTSKDGIKLPVNTTHLPINKPCSLEVGCLNKEKQQLLKQSQKQQRFLLPTAKNETTTIPPASNAVASQTLTKQQIVANVATTTMTDNHDNRKLLKRVNKADIEYLPSKDLLDETLCNPALSKRIKASPSKIVQTQQILDKLQTLGLQVKRKEQPIKQTPSSPPVPSVDPEKEKALQILKKLQSKGMNVKIIQPSRQTSADNFQTQGRCLQKPEANVSHVPANVPVQRKLIIKKLN